VGRKRDERMDSEDGEVGDIVQRHSIGVVIRSPAG
jgi:hypothetical protein